MQTTSDSRREPQTNEIELKRQYVKKLISAIGKQNNERLKGQFIERVISTISDLFKLEDGIETELDFYPSNEQPEEIPKEKLSEEDQGELHFCAECKRATEVRCTGCCLVFYCSKECQKKDWSKHKKICRPYTVVRRKDCNKAIVACRDLGHDELILNETPMVLGPQPGASIVCIKCLRKTDGEERCNGCSFPVCSQECLGETHSPFECKIIENFSQKQILEESEILKILDSITTLRCLIYEKENPEKWRAMIERFDQRTLELMGSSDCNQEILTTMKENLMIDVHFGREIPESDLRLVLGLVQMYNTPLKLPYSEAQGIFRVASLLSHSCIPNAKLQWDDDANKLRITASEQITRGSPFTAIFTDILWGTRIRRDHLLQSRAISCSCQRCSDPTEYGTYFSALVCSSCPKRSYLLSMNPLDNSSAWKCQNCNQQVGVKEVIELTNDLSNEVSDALQNSSVLELENLQMEWTKKFHKNHYHLHAVKHSLFQLYARSSDLEESDNEALLKEITKKEKACKEFLSVCARLDPSLSNTMNHVGLTFFEYQKTILCNAKFSFNSGKINKLQLKKRVLLSKKLLKKAMQIFRTSPLDTPEGQMYLRCQEDVIAIGKWMLSVQLV